MQIGTAEAQQSFVFDGGNHDLSRAVAGDSLGNVFVGGSSRSSKAIEFAVIKHSPQGSFQWLARPQTPSGTFGGAALDVVTDSAGNVYAVGFVHRQVNLLVADVDWVVASFDNRGAQRWVHVLSNVGFDQALKVNLDPAGAIYATGNSGGGWLTIKYSLGGSILWQRTEVGADVNRAVGASLDPQGNLAVLGATSVPSSGGIDDAKVVKYDGAGATLWTRRFTISDVSDDEPADIATDPSGAVYITGTSFTSGFPEGPAVSFLAKYDATGAPSFAITGHGAGGSSVEANGTGVATLGSTTDENGGPGGTFVAKLNFDGSVIWSRTTTALAGLAISPEGNVFTAATAFAPGGGVLQISEFGLAGQLLAEHLQPGGQSVTDVALAPNGDFLVTGNTSNFLSDIITVRVPAGAEPPVLPSAPSNLSLGSGKGRLTLRWRDNSGNESGFRIERSVNGGAFVEIAQVGANNTSFTDTGLIRRTTYTYRLRAFNGAGSSSYSNTASGQPK